MSYVVVEGYAADMLPYPCSNDSRKNINSKELQAINPLLNRVFH